MNPDENKLNSWLAQLRKNKDKRRNFVKQLSRLVEDIKDLNRKIRGLNIKIDNYKKSDFHLSDHFVIRFRERVRNIPIPEMKREIFSDPRFVNCAKILFDGQFPCSIFGKEYFIIVKNKILITILNQDDNN